MAASSSAAAAAEPRLPKHDVFISFRGEDTRKSFTSHLYLALSRKQIEAYKDDVDLKKGDNISPSLVKAIEKSEVSIIIFSKNYASSSWCLDELVHILKCKEEKARIVLPIFLGIDPSHIRKQEESYAAAFEKHEQRFGTEKVQKWRQALKDAAAISGWDSRNMSESKIVEEVVERVSTELDTIKSKRSDDFKGLVGIPERLEIIKSFLDSQAVRVVGIWGMGGIGKTTLAKLVFSRFYNDFDGSCFSPSVRENVIKKGLDTLEKEMFSELLGEKNLNIFKSDVDHRLSRKRILLVLDDVDDFVQLERLAENRQFGPGSKIILTSRDLQVLNQLNGVTYEVQELDPNEASQLFYLKAFEENSCRTGYEEISAEVIRFTRGNPLALQVLGSYLKSLSIKDCESALEKLKRIPHVNIQKVLRISYDGLDTEEQDAFLDIACFLKNEKKDFVEGILGHKSIIAITVLVHKSLITIDQYGLIRMHDLIQEMGWEIVRQSTKKLGERSRLWTAEDVSNVLENNKGTEAIEGIYLPWIEGVEVHLRPDVFEEMCKLRLLKIYAARQYFSEFKVYIDGDLKYLPNELRYLHWERYPGKSLPSNFKPQNLVELDMPYSKLERLWDGVQKLGSLKHINLYRSVLLTEIPDLSQAPKLESINLCDCVWLIHIPSLNLQATMDESAYRHQWPRVKLGYNEFQRQRTPGSIILDGCRRLETFPKVSGNIRKLSLSRTAVKELPSSIESFENLLILNVAECYNLKSLPQLPRNIEVLILDYSDLEQIPSSSIEHLCSLRILSLGYCKRLASEFIPKTLCKLTRLQELYLCYTKIESFPMVFGLCYLTKLNMSGCNLREIPDWLGSLTSLTELYLQRNSFLRIPASIGMLYKLKELDISDCHNLQSLPASIGMLYKLKWLNINDCKNLRALPELPLFIESVDAEDCSSLEMVSTAEDCFSTVRSTLTLGRWLDKYDSDSDNYQREFSFLNCTKLGEEAINNIFTEFLYKVFCTATTPPEVVVSKRVIGKVVVCYPTKEIPGWFKNQSDGSTITIELPTNWYNPKTFLGFVVSVVVVVVEDEYDYEDYSTVECILHLRTDRDRFRVNDDHEYMFRSRLDHIVMWYNYFDHSKVNFEKEYEVASFEFKSRFLKVKRCGVRMLYLRDAVEKFDDGTTVNFESWRIDVIDSDSASNDDFQSRGSDDDFQSCGSDADDQSHES